MQVQWRKLITKMTVWLLAEVVLTYVGLDNLADYGEYLLSGNDVNHQAVPVQVYETHPNKV